MLSDVHESGGPGEESAATLRRERDFWRTLFETVVAEFPEPALVVDGDGVITHWNDECASITDVPATEAVGRLVDAVVGSDGDETIAERTIRTGEAVRETEIRSGTSASGTEWHTRDLAVPLRGMDGSVVGAFEVAGKVTDLVEKRRRLERLQRHISGDVQSAVREATDSTESVAESSAEISGLADDQSAAMAEVTAEVARLSEAIDRVAANAEAADERSGAVEASAEASRTSAGEAMDAMAEIDAVGETVAGNATDLGERVARIDATVDVIRRLADQTNLLALNASIEAARAGEAGSGFAVVAEEIKELANESQRRAGEIEDVVADVRENSDDTISSVRTLNETVSAGRESVERSLDALREIAAVVEGTSRDVAEISNATREEAASARDVAKLVAAAGERAERVSDEVETVAAANEEQAAMLAEISRSIARLDVESLSR